MNSTRRTKIQVKKRKKVKRDRSMYDALVMNYGDELKDSKYPEGMEHCVVGIEERTLRLILSKMRVLNHLVEEERLSMEDALEHYSFNIEGSYVGEGTPIFLDDTTGII